jgi:hypothetical protein
MPFRQSVHVFIRKWGPFTPLCPAAFLALILAFNLARHLCVAVAFPYEVKGWSEGHLLYNAIQLSRGENTYVDPDKKVCTSFGYGFLYPAVMMPFVLIFGAQLWIGRAVSIAAAIGTLVLLFLLARERARHWLAGILAVVLALGTYKLTGESWDWTHPDSLFACLGVASVVALTTPQTGRLWGATLAATLGVLSFLTKQPGAGFLVGTALFLLWRRDKTAVPYVVMVAALVTGTLGLAQLLTDGWYLRYTADLMASHSYDLSKLRRAVYPGLEMCPGISGPLATTVPVLLLMGIWEVVALLRRAPGQDPLPWILIGVGIPSLAALAKENGANNNLTPVLLLLTVPASVRIVDLFRAYESRPALRTSLSCLLLVQVAVAPREFGNDEQISDAHRRIGELIRNEVRQTTGPVLVGHRISFAYLNHRQVYDSFAMVLEWGRCGRQKNWGRLVRQLDERHFAKVLIPWDTDRWLTDDVFSAIQRDYRVHHLLGDVLLRNFSPVWVLVPRTPAK